MALPTAADIRGISLKSITGTSLDTQITKAIRAADELCARYCLFPQVSASMPSLDVAEPGASYVLYPKVDRRDSRILRLNLRPIVTITYVKQDIDGLWTYTQTSVENTDFVTDVNGNLILHPNSTKPWIGGLRGIAVSCIAGFDVANHEPTKTAIAIMTAHLWSNGYMNPGVQTTTAGAQSVTMKADSVALPPAVRQILEPYRLVEREAER